MKAGFVYLVGSEIGFYKIGKTADVRSRVSSLQVGSPIFLTLLAYIECRNPLLVERLLHHRFARHLRHGEWFALSAKAVIRCQVDMMRLSMTPCRRLLHLVALTCSRAVEITEASPSGPAVTLPPEKLQEIVDMTRSTKSTRPLKTGLGAIVNPARRRAAAERARLASMRPKRLKTLSRVASQVDSFIRSLNK